VNTVNSVEQQTSMRFTLQMRQLTQLPCIVQHIPHTVHMNNYVVPCIHTYV